MLARTYRNPIRKNCCNLESYSDQMVTFNIKQRCRGFPTVLFQEDVTSIREKIAQYSVVRQLSDFQAVTIVEDL